MSGPHRKPPTLATLVHLTEDVKARIALHVGQARSTFAGKNLTRVTGGVAVGAALVATVAATASVADAPRSGRSLVAAAESQDTVNDFLATGRAAEPLAKLRKAPARPQHTRVKAEDVIKLAEEQVGITETNGQGGGTKFQDWYATTDRAWQTTQRDGGGSPSEYKNAAWCVMFLSWIGKQLDFNDQIGSDAWTITHAQWFKDKGRWGDTPEPGAIVYFDWDGGSSDLDAIDHVGLVTKVNGDGTIDTVEGNISDAVVSKTRTLDNVVGFGYPDYAK
ncbi:MAG: CHAP domain-containing protein [Actinomadura sp.]